MLSDQMNLLCVLVLFPSQLVTIIYVNVPHQLGEYNGFFFQKIRLNFILKLS